MKAYVKRNKNDAADAEATCEAVRRPTMRFVPVKSAEQQGQLMQHRARDLLMRAAWVGLVPRQDSTGGKRKLGPISKQGESDRIDFAREAAMAAFAKSWRRE